MPAVVERSLGCGHQTLRGVLFLINFIFFAASLAGIIITTYLHSKKQSTFLKFCPACEGFNVLAISVMGFVFLASLLGVFATWKRNGCMLLSYGFFLVIFFLAALAATIGVILMKKGDFNHALALGWDRAVEKGPNDICEFMKVTKCNGWDLHCNNVSLVTNYTNTTVEGQRCPMCLPEYDPELINSFNITCHEDVKSTINKYYGEMVGIGFALIGIAMISIYITASIRKKYVSEYQEMHSKAFM
jgi:hypothetical protein